MEPTMMGTAAEAAPLVAVTAPHDNPESSIPTAPAASEPAVLRSIPATGAASIAAMEQLIGELQSARDYLQVEGERIQREAARYNHLSETASASVRIISASLGKWREAHRPARVQAG